MKVKGTQIDHQWVMKITGDFQASEAYEREMGHYGWYQGRTREFFGGLPISSPKPNPKSGLKSPNIGSKPEKCGAPEDVQVREVARLMGEEVMSADAELTRPSSKSSLKRPQKRSRK